MWNERRLSLRWWSPTVDKFEYQLAENLENKNTNEQLWWMNEVEIK